MKKNISFRSCYIVDVQPDYSADLVRLEDSARNAYYVQKSNATALASFKAWFKTIFMRGIAQTLSVFSYDVSFDAESEPRAYINQFFYKHELLEA